MKAARRTHDDFAERLEDEATLNAMELYDNGLTFAEIGKTMGRTSTWARDVITGVLLEEGATAPLH